MIFKRRELMSNPFRMKVYKKGLPSTSFTDIYHSVLATSWIEFFAINSTLYVMMNMFWATMYYLGGNQIVNADPNSYWDAFVFSFQTSTTIGYGHLLPGSLYTDIIVMLDTLSGILYVAITTGLAFAKFSRPTTRVIFTKNCVVHQYEGKETLFFRVANARDSHIADASIVATIVMADRSREGVTMQRIKDMELVRSKTPVFALSWTVMHIIDEKSPIFGMTTAEMEAQNVRIVVSLTGIDDWTAQIVHTNRVYQASDVIYGKRFDDILTDNEDSSVTMDYSKFNDLVDFNPKSR